MKRTHTSTRRRGRRAAGAAAVTLALVAASCGSDDDSSSDDAAESEDTEAAAETESTEAPAETEDTEAPAETESTEAPAETEDTEAPAETESTEAPAEGEGDGGEDDWTTAFPDLAPPAGEELVIGLVNTEGAPGLDFPDIRNYVNSTVDYLNEHGGIGDRPIALETCVANGSPEGSQACAQELAGKDIEMVLIGLDVFVDYATFEAAGIPIVGMLPILPTDNTANARYLTGGNSTTVGAMAAVAKEHFGATSVGIVSADNPGANATEAGLTAALDLAGLEHMTVKGGDAETDAGFQGLMRQAADAEPDVLVSLYADAGCIGTIRGRASLGIEIPVITTGICSGSDVINEVGDDALGWHFIGISTQEENTQLEILQEIVAPVEGIAPEEVDSTSLGLGALGIQMVLSVAGYGNLIAADGGEISGQALYDYIGEGEGLTFWPGTTEIECGANDAYPAVCAYTFPVAAYDESGEVLTVPGLESVSAIDYLP